MKKINKILFYCILISFLHSCSGTSDAAKVLKNEKITNTDEFLVKKRDPLILPPDYNTLPSPNSIKESKKNNDNKINFILLKNIGKTTQPNAYKISVDELKRLGKIISEY